MWYIDIPSFCSDLPCFGLQNIKYIEFTAYFLILYYNLRWHLIENTLFLHKKIGLKPLTLSIKTKISIFTKNGVILFLLSTAVTNYWTIEKKTFCFIPRLIVGNEEKIRFWNSWFVYYDFLLRNPKKTKFMTSHIFGVKQA